MKKQSSGTCLGYTSYQKQDLHPCSLTQHVHGPKCHVKDEGPEAQTQGYKASITSGSGDPSPGRENEEPDFTVPEAGLYVKESLRKAGVEAQGSPDDRAP